MSPERRGLWGAWGRAYAVFAAQAGLFALAALHFNVIRLVLWSGHLALLACLALFMVLLPAAVGMKRRQGLLRFRWAAAIAGGAVTLLLGLGYVYDLMCRALWGDQGTLGLLWRFRREIPHIVEILGPSIFFLPLILLFWLGSVVLAWDRVWRVEVRMRQGLARSLAMLAASLLLVAAIRASSGSSFWSDDPTIGMLMSDEQLIPLTPPRIHEIYLDQQARRDLKASAAAQQAKSKSKTKVPSLRHAILVIVDAERPDHMGVYGYGRATTPFLSELKSRGELAVVEEAYSNGPVSACGILGLLKSRPSGQVSSRLLGLSEAFAAHGWESRVFTTGDDDWYGMGAGYGPWTTQMVSGEGQSRYDISDDRVILDGLAALPPAGEKPTFLFFHLMTVHEMGRVDPAFQVYQPSLPVSQFSQSYPEGRRQALVNGYDGRVLQADDTLRRIFQALEAKGYLDQAVAVITADHGQMLGEHDAWGHAHGRLWEDVLRVPMLVWGRPLPLLGRRRGAYSLDVGPSLMRWAGLPAPSTWLGKPLQEPEAPRLLEHEHVTTVFGRGALTLLDGKGGIRRYLAKREGGGLTERAFQVDKDPLETVDIFPELTPDQAAFFRREGRLRLEPGLGLPSP